MENVSGVTNGDVDKVDVASVHLVYVTSKGGVTSFAEKPELILLKITSFFSDLLGKNSGFRGIVL